MKKQRNYFVSLAMLALALITFSCSGDDGAIGPEGAQGVQGEVGPAGKDGSTVYSGEGLPLNETGLTNDYYLDVTTGLLYGPKKADDSWEAASNFSLKGEKGADGADGSRILSGTGIPENTVGLTGDYYLNKETYTLYGPKKRIVIMGQTLWGMGLELKGADGKEAVKTFVATVASTDWQVVNNNPTSNLKYFVKELAFPALNKDMNDNGIIMVYWKRNNNLYQLPKTEVTPKQNIKLHRFYIQESRGSYKMVIKQEINCIKDITELLTASSASYRIKLITGLAATELSAVKDNPEELMKAATEMGLID